MELKQPLLIIVDGVNGSGKTSVVQAMQDLLDQEGISSAIVDIIPKGPIRTLIKEDPSLSPIQRALLFKVESMSAHDIVQKHLDAGKTVIMDRGFFSFLAFQGYAEDLNWEVDLLEVLCKKPFLQADVAVFLSPPLEVCQARLTTRPTEKDHYEEISDAFDQRVYEGYQKVFDAEQQRPSYAKHVVMITDDLPPKLVATITWEGIKDHLQQQPE